MPPVVAQVASSSRIRVLVVDDSVVVRRLIVKALEEDPGIEVAGYAPNGAAGLAKIPQVNPDVVTLDIEMPEMDGLEMLRHLRRDHPQLRVIMLSSLTERGALITLEALALGAKDYVTKPSNTGSVERSLEMLRQNLLPKIRQFFPNGPVNREGVRSGLAAPDRGPAPPAFAPRPSRALKTVNPKVLAIGSSTGGPNALSVLVPAIPAGFPVPVLIVQHMPPLFTRLLAERLKAMTPLAVEEAQEGSRLEPAKILLARGDHHMRVVRRGAALVTALTQDEPRNSCRPAVDVLFESVADVYGGDAVAVILTGMGQDGLRGTEALRNLGAHVIAQDEATSVVWGMPGAVARAGLADQILPLGELASAITGQFCYRGGGN